MDTDIPSCFLSALEAADRAPDLEDPEQWPRLFSSIPLDVFGLLLLGVPATLPRLRSHLPMMPSDDVQRQWTGNAGRTLLMQSVAFVRSMLDQFAHVRSTRRLADAWVLDYGCGWGRLTRLLYKYVPYSRLYALDPWDESIRICRETNVRGHVGLCDWVPQELPVGDVQFDLVLSFSVFTHLSERCHRAVLAALRKRMSRSGLLALTVRPVEYWDAHAAYPTGRDADLMKRAHAEHGYAFLPQNRAPIDGDITYGDTSVSLEYIREQWTEWQIVAVDYNLIDAYQVCVFLVPR